jgi:hypothetical protein
MTQLCSRSLPTKATKPCFLNALHWGKYGFAGLLQREREGRVRQKNNGNGRTTLKQAYRWRNLDGNTVRQLAFTLTVSDCDHCG